MSKGGELVPEVAEHLRLVIGRLREKGADPSDLRFLEKLATQLAGEDRRHSLRLHYRKGQPALGAAGVDRRYAMAAAVRAHRQEHGGSLEEAYRALSGRFGNVGPETLAKAWKEMSPLLEMEEPARDTLLLFKRLEARGLASVRRVQKGK